MQDKKRAVEVTWIKDEKVRKQAAEMLSAAGMTIAYGGQPRPSYNRQQHQFLDEKARMTALNSLKEGIDEAYELGVKGFAFLAGKYEESTKEESYQALLNSTKELCAYAKLRVICELRQKYLIMTSIKIVDWACGVGKALCGRHALRV